MFLQNDEEIMMKISKARIKEIIREELKEAESYIPHPEVQAARQEWEDMYAENPASHLRLLYNELWRMMEDELMAGKERDFEVLRKFGKKDQEIRDKIEEIQIKLNEPSK